MKQLDVVTVISNPCRYESRYRLYQDFEKHMLDSGVRLTTVEAAFGERPYEVTDSKNDRHIQVRIQDELWNKENLLNIGIQNLPEDSKYVMWSDADITFMHTSWAEEVVHALQHYEVVQPFSHAIDLGPKKLGEPVVQTHAGFAYQYVCGKPIGFGKGYEFAHPGYCWAARKDTLDKVEGLMDRTLLGAADHIMALSLINRAKDSLAGGLHPNYYKMAYRWQDLAVKQIKGDLGYVSGTIMHHWHGKKENRKYIERWGILQKHQYDPYVDILRSTNGTLRLTDNKPGLRDDLRAYFRQRQEDEQTL